MKPDKSLKPGDRVTINVAKVSGWEGFGPRATIWGTWREDATGGGSSHNSSIGEDYAGGYKIRLDGYDYGAGTDQDPPGEGNNHTAHWSVINPEPTEDEVAEALASITETLRRSP